MWEFNTYTFMLQGPIDIDTVYDPAYGYRIPYSQRVGDELHAFNCKFSFKNASSESTGVINVVRK